MMRIAQVTATFPPHYTGTGMVCYYNALGLARLGHKVTVFTAADPSGSFTYPKEIIVHRLPILFQFGNAPLLPDLFRIDGFDLIHLHHPFIFGSEMIWTNSWLRNTPYIVTHHNNLKDNGVKGKVFKLYSSLSTPILFNSAKMCAFVSLEHAAHNGYKHSISMAPQKYVEIPNGVDVEFFSPKVDGKKIREKNGICDDAIVLLFIGVLDSAHHYRRVDLLINSLSKLDEKSVYLIIVGDGGQLKNYRDLVDNLGLTSQVHFLGRVPHNELPPIYTAADIFILPSVIQEAFPLVVLEAMACGKPVIVSDLPGVRSMIDDGRNGLLVQPGNLQDLVKKINILLESADKRRDYGNCGRLKVKQQYTWKNIIPQLENLYLKTLESK
jgi:glycosyltransferase involved in cell wall biosynthesis